MCTSMVAFLLLLAGPLVFLAFRFGGIRSPAIRWALGALVVGILLTRSPEEGFDVVHLDRVKLVLAVAMAVVLAFGRALDDSGRRFLIAVLAAASLLAHYNFLAFHGRGSFVHAHDVAHYYLGSKYAEEIHYGELYAAVARAEAEIHDGRLPVDHVRDLTTGGIVPIAGALERGETTRARFEDERWRGFRRDVEALHGLMGPRFAAFLNDHGYNPTPVWSLVGGAVARFVPAGSEAGIRTLALADPLLLAVALGATWWAFGFEIAAIAAAYYGILYGALFSWSGGGFLRNLWFAATIVGAASAHRARPVVGGACLALAAGLRVFPIFFLFGPLVAIAREALGPRGPRTAEIRLVGSAAITGLALFIAAIVFEGGIGRWWEFRENMSAHRGALSSNFVGLPSWLRYLVLGIGIGGEAEVERLFAPVGSLYHGLVALLFVGAAAVAARLSLRTDDAAMRMALGLFPIVFGLQLAHYYYVALVLLVFAHRDRPDRLALLFAAETVVYGLGLFEVHFSVMCLFRGLVAAYLLIALWFEPLGEDARSVRSRPAEVG